MVNLPLKKGKIMTDKTNEVILFLLGIFLGVIGAFALMDVTVQEIIKKHKGYKQIQCKEDFICELKLK